MTAVLQARQVGRRGWLWPHGNYLAQHTICGQTFQSFFEFLTAKDQYQKEKFFYFSVEKSDKNLSWETDGEQFWYKSKLYICSHGRRIRHDMKINNTRPGQNYNSSNQC